ncbi:hypothetical protein EYF80_011647 [Liparis tanakae]|uniref:Uncharacterized protein n=1 Tax=Liparis tanakae TaxID=230148 RepID=A0A4Z2ILS0_9TELE|nr:hypothetical protein EYF80_011647 [Liparis tanakae]
MLVSATLPTLNFPGWPGTEGEQKRTITVFWDMMWAWTFRGGLAGACSPVRASTRVEGGPWPMLLKADTLISYSVLGYRPPML